MYCSKCGAMVSDAASFCSACGQPTGGAGGPQTQAGVLPPPPQPAVAATAPALYAGFWLRVVAAIIDYIIIGIPLGAIFFAMMASSLPALMRMQQGESPMVLVAAILPRLIVLGILSLVGSWLYWAALESSDGQATLGKKALGLYVTDMEGRRCSFGKTSGRFWGGR
ncbi:MAG: RDD family protein, partial [Acidobacteriota bacterium]|nr:RDD family protein [Acidobacteriota bacterium]